MIRYSLICEKGHRFDSWFASASAYDALKSAGHLSCAECGSARVDKALMTPAVTSEPETPNLTARTLFEERLAALRKQIEENSDYVGANFVAEARAIHEGTAPERAIWGEARLDEARALVEDGVPVAPLPFLPKTRTN
ncbi:MAG: DUF1178 family protein [Pararhodobacter sp.]